MKTPNLNAQDIAITLLGTGLVLGLVVRMLEHSRAVAGLLGF